jgi:hypothetical protein
MKSIQPIQMIGTQRSGSNLLRLLLNQYVEIVAPHPPHILQRFYPLLPVYGDLSDNMNMMSLVDDVCVLVEKNPVLWNGISLDRQEIMSECRNNSLIEIFRVIYDKMAITHNASKWLCKSMANVYFATEMENEGLSPLYIYLYRDGRDVACSFKKAIVGEKHVYHIAKAWKRSQLACLELNKLINDERFITLSYEDLIHAPEKELTRLNKFLNLKFDKTSFDYYNSLESRNTAKAGKMWENVTKPILANNSGKFLKELSKEEIVIFESIAGDVLEILGYDLVYPEESTQLVIDEHDIANFNKENQILKEKSNLLADPEGKKLRLGQDELIESIKRRKTL